MQMELSLVYTSSEIHWPVVNLLFSSKKLLYYLLSLCSIVFYLNTYIKPNLDVFFEVYQIEWVCCCWSCIYGHLIARWEGIPSSSHWRKTKFPLINSVHWRSEVEPTLQVGGRGCLVVFFPPSLCHATWCSVHGSFIISSALFDLLFPLEGDGQVDTSLRAGLR